MVLLNRKGLKGSAKGSKEIYCKTPLRTLRLSPCVLCVIPLRTLWLFFNMFRQVRISFIYAEILQYHSLIIKPDYLPVIISL